ncbi:hypothetical protein BsIDN1_08560 [Bacillus safensis]|uniref:EamA domain-containing protein n=1 Tax=Bacillus safensis TaxID=561879 RepID=A0A5S9M3D9_BACIA|nr:hypothetical protein BsIDN1_08560 [Bacillus safensis]
MALFFLGVASMLLIWLFDGKTEHLIPLYAVGVFIPFTLSQTGMCVKWIREKPQGWKTKMPINIVGALIFFHRSHDSHFDQVPSCMASICFHANCAIDLSFH